MLSRAKNSKIRTECSARSNRIGQLTVWKFILPLQLDIFTVSLSIRLLVIYWRISEARTFIFLRIIGLRVFNMVCYVDSKRL